MKKFLLLSLILSLVVISATFAAPPTGTLSKDWSVENSDVGPVRAGSYNPTTGHFLMSVMTAVVVIDGNNGTILGSLADPDGSIAIGVPMGMCCDETGVIYMFSYTGSGYVYRWAYEGDTAPVIAVYATGMGVPRGFCTYGSGVNTKMFQAGATGSLSADDGPINTLTTVDGTTFTVDAGQVTEAAAAKTGVAVSNNGNTLYGFRPWGTVPLPQEGVTKWDNYGVWVKDVSTFLIDPTLATPTSVGPQAGWAVAGDVDPDYNVVFVYNYYAGITTYDNVTSYTSQIVAINATSGAVIDKMDIGICSYYGGVGVDRATHKIYWAARVAPSTNVITNYGRMSYTIPLGISIDSVNMGPTGSATLSAQYGTAPYTWSLSTTGIVSLSTTAGATVTVNAVAPGTVNVILTDATMVTKICTVVVIPTSTDIWQDSNKVIIHRVQLLGELFE